MFEVSGRQEELCLIAYMKKTDFTTKKGNRMYRYEQWITVLILCVSVILKAVSIFTLYTAYAHATVHHNPVEKELISTQQI